MSKHFSDRLLEWFDHHGRHDLPWQQNSTPFRVWVSEIMLQQTQVVTVIPYFERFMKSFPDVEALANASMDEVLHHWTGLGYYARARNLHKTAKIITKENQGHFPSSLDEMMALPGIGRSTAGAILSLASEQRHPILDGNVKRVLSRYYGVEGWPGKKKVEQELWTIAEKLIPKESIKDYTQAIMDLGATVCPRRNPVCNTCPLTKDCFAKKSNRQNDFPGAKPKKVLPIKETVFAIIENAKGEVLLQKRQPSGIWGGLWCFPEISSEEPIAGKIKQQYGFDIKQQTKYNSFKHTFSHFHLLINPVHIRLKEQAKAVNDEGLSIWIEPSKESGWGFPTPVVSLLKDLNNEKR